MPVDQLQKAGAGKAHHRNRGQRPGIPAVMKTVADQVFKEKNLTRAVAQTSGRELGQFDQPPFQGIDRLDWLPSTEEQSAGGVGELIGMRVLCDQLNRRWQGAGGDQIDSPSISLLFIFTNGHLKKSRMDHKLPPRRIFLVFLPNLASTISGDRQGERTFMQFKLNINPGPQSPLLPQHGQRRRAGRPVMAPGHTGELGMNRQTTQATPAPIQLDRLATGSTVRTGMAAGVRQSTAP